ncbi:hypothetical protein GE061_016427 [Apolygus lucorum]|uniref:Uncharacterized protein n=1 Tax=Apolygus lucorum TaxID=248454 RepID=A0A8S9XI80_APOLU|nr:hypothetical protein GE061_016427 [Apolygus lucorum]
MRLETANLESTTLQDYKDPRLQPHEYTILRDYRYSRLHPHEYTIPRDYRYSRLQPHEYTILRDYRYSKLQPHEYTIPRDYRYSRLQPHRDQSLQPLETTETGNWKPRVYNPTRLQRLETATPKSKSLQDYRGLRPQPHESTTPQNYNRTGLQPRDTITTTNDYHARRRANTSSHQHPRSKDGQQQVNANPPHGWASSARLPGGRRCLPQHPGRWIRLR